MIMATVDQKGTRYEEFCRQLYSNTVQEVRQQILTFFDVERNIIEGLNIHEDTKFIDILEQKNIISASNVDKLLECFNKLGQMKLAERVMIYMSTIATETSTQRLWEDDDEDLKMCQCPTNRGEQEKLLCLNCSKYICYDCFLNHRNHEVVSEDKLDGVIGKYQESVQKELSEVKKITESCKEDVNIVRMNSNVEELQVKVAGFYKILHASMKKQLDVSKEEYAKVKTARDEALTEANKEFCILSTLSSNVSKNVEQSQGSSNLKFLQKLNNLKEEICRGIEIAKTTGETVESVVQYCPASLSARFATITVGPILGAVRVKRHVIIVTDQRLKDQPSIHLSCVSCDNTDDIYWSHAIEYLKILESVAKLPIISICNILYIIPPKFYVLIGCGWRIIRIEILLQNDSCFYRSFAVEEVKGLPKGSHIICIQVIPGRRLTAGVLIVDSVSNSITRLDRELVHMESLSLQEKPLLVAGVFDNKRFIYAYSNGKEVKIINGDSPKNVIRVIYTPPGPRDFYPVDMFHDFAAFSVLWKNRDIPGQSNKFSKVVVYSSNGELKRICHEQKEGSSEGIGISYSRNGGLLCSANGAVALYDTLVKENDRSALLHSLLGHVE